MKKSLIYILLLLMVPMGLLAQPKTVGTTGADYTTLKTAFDAINAGTITGAITLQIIDTTYESVSATLNSSGTGSANYTSVVIYPTFSSLKISGNLPNPLIDLNGADNVTIDGRVNATGAARDLTIVNKNTAGAAGTSAIQLKNDASFNVIKYCILKGSETGTTSGVVYFNLTTGSEGNVIDNNDITSSADASRPVNAIYSLGLPPAKATSPNTISNNNIFNHLNRSIASNGISLAANNSDWMIKGNSFYETVPFAPAANVAYAAIRISNAGVNYNISDNFIGGNAPLCLGTALTKTNEVNNAFIGIYLNVATGTASNVQNNTIKNFDWRNATSATWTGIQIARGDVNVGTVTGNTIGAATGTGSILVTGSTLTGGYSVYGILIQSPGNVDCRNNQIGSITVANADATGCNFYGIFKNNSAGNTTVNNNTIGSPDEPNSILASSPSTGYAQTVRGIYNAGTGTIIISDNTIANLNNGTTNSTVGNVAAAIGRINGIYSSSATGTHTISGNIIRDLTISNANNQPNLNASVCGIALNSPCAKNVTGNTIYNLSNTYASFTGHINGLLYMGSTTNNTIDRNFIHSLTVPSSAGASISGIRINTGASTYSNNIIALGGNTLTTIYGIYEYGLAGNDNKLYHNTVYIGGSPASGTNRSYALYSDVRVTANIRDFSNNIFANTRSTAGGTNLHYAIYIAATEGTIACNFNDYWVSGTGGIMGYYGANKTTLPVVDLQDGNSQAADPVFGNAGGTSAVDYIPGNCSLAAPVIPAVPDDYVPVTRPDPDPTLMGAFHVTPCLRVEVYKSSVFQAAYPNLKSAFDAFNSGIHNTGSFEIKITGDIFETSKAELKASGTVPADYTSVIIYPTIPGVKISGSLAAPLIELNGADNVTIDGRVNATGLIRDLTNMTITNSSNSSVAGTSTIRMINSATNNTVKYCWLRGSETSPNSGVIFFSASTGTSGNNGNVIDNNYITNSDNSRRPVNAIYSLGTATFENSGNTVSNNDIFDCLNPGRNSHSICISTNSTGWTISGNSFYETTSFTPAGNVTFYIIRINNTGGNYSISGNYIGGGTPLCGNPAWIKSNTFNNVFFGIHLNARTGTSNSIQGNTIRNFDWSNSLSGNWTGIHLLRGNADVGTVTGNTIGAAAGTGSILVTSKTTGNNVYGINIATPGIVNCLNNNIGSITIANADANGSNFYGISKSAGGATTISNNTIGSSLTVNSISATSASTGNTQTVHGIYTTGTGLITLSGNTIANLTNGTTNAAGSIIGLYFTGNTGANRVSENFIHTLALSASADSIYGIKTKAGSCTYSNNIITLGSDMENIIYGIFETGVAGNNNIWFNTVYIGGSPASGTNKSYALYSAVITNTRIFTNNLFMNARSTAGGTNLHYAMYIAAAGGTITCNNNDYWAPGTGGILGYYGADRTILPIVTGKDVASQAIDPSFASTGVNPTDYIPAAYLQGVAGTGVTTDFGGNPRIIPTMGAWEGYINKWKGETSTDWNDGRNWISGIVPGQDASIIFDTAPSNNCAMDQDRSVLNITNFTTYSIVTNGHKLTIKGNLFFSSGDKIDATASGSTVEIASDSIRTIEKVQFSADKVYNLIINNALGVSLNSNFTVDNSLTINAGRILTISSPSLLTVTGILTNNAGTTGLVIRSDGNGNDAKLINQTPSVPATIELFLSGGESALGPIFHYFVPPVASMSFDNTSVASAAADLGLTNFDGQLLNYSESFAADNQDNGWQYFDGYDWGLGPTTPFNTLQATMGYNIGLTANDKITFRGLLNAASHSYNNLSFTNLGMNLIGNPYPCNYDITGIPELMGSNDGVDNTIYFNHDGGYAYYNPITGGTAGFTNIIAPMQGFFVEATATGSSVHLPADFKTSGTAGPLRSKGEAAIAISKVSKIKLAFTNGKSVDEAIVCFIDDATAGFDSDYDAHKLFSAKSKSSSIYTELRGIEYAINSVAMPSAGVLRIPVTVVLKNKGTYTINISEFENLDGYKVRLKHGAVETILQRNTTYSFTSGTGTYKNLELIIGDEKYKPVDETNQEDQFKTWYKNDIMFISCPSDALSDKGTLKIYNIQGTLIYNDNQIYIEPGQTLQIPIHLTRGMYISNIISNNMSFKMKILVF